MKTIVYIWKKLDSVSKYQIAQVPSFGDQLPIWPVAQLVEHRTSKPKVAGSNPAQAKYIFLCLSLMVRQSEKHLITILYPSSLNHNNHNVWRLLF